MKAVDGEGCLSLSTEKVSHPYWIFAVHVLEYAPFLGFAKNQFNYGKGFEHLGNHVLLVSSTRSYECEMHKDGSTETQIVCYTM